MLIQVEIPSQVTHVYHCYSACEAVASYFAVVHAPVTDRIHSTYKVSVEGPATCREPGQLVSFTLGGFSKGSAAGCGTIYWTIAIGQYVYCSYIGLSLPIDCHGPTAYGTHIGAEHR